MAIIASRLTNTGTLLVNGIIDEVTQSTISANTNTLLSALFDEVSNSGTNVVRRDSANGTVQISGILDEFTGAPVVDANLKLWLDTGQTTSYPGSGSTWTDLSGAGNNGLLVNSPTFSSSNGGFFVFNGTNQYVNLGSSNAITGNNPTALTLEVWVNYTSTTPDRLIVIQRGSGGLNSALAAIQINNNQAVTGIGYLQFVTRNSTNTNVEYLRFNGNYNLVGKFQNFVATITGTSRALYVNGVLVASDTATGLPSITGNTDPALLAVQPGLVNFFNGSMAVAKVYNRALTADEVAQNFNALRRRYNI